MKDLFRSFSRERVRFLLIGGQATVVYGAAQFTQDFDVWVDPSAANLRAFLRALARSETRVHKLTPPVTPKWARRGHGFHFIVPSAPSPVPLDMMGRPPRVGSFDSAARRALLTRTPWGRIPVASHEDLVRLKRTNRPGDYEVVARLARLRLEAVPRPSPALVLWAVENTLLLEPLGELMEAHAGQVARLGKRLPQAARHFVAGDESRAERLLGAELTRAIRAGRRYWTPILAELRRLRTRGDLVPEGTPVRDLLQRPV